MCLGCAATKGYSVKRYSSCAGCTQTTSFLGHPRNHQDDYKVLFLNLQGRQETLIQNKEIWGFALPTWRPWRLGGYIIGLCRSHAPSMQGWPRIVNESARRIRIMDIEPLPRFRIPLFRSSPITPLNQRLMPNNYPPKWTISPPSTLQFPPAHFNFVHLNGAPPQFVPKLAPQTLR